MTRPKGTKISFRAEEHLSKAIDKFVEEEGLKSRSDFIRCVVIFFFMAKMTGFIKKGDITKVEKRFGEKFIKEPTELNQDDSCQ